MSYYGNNYDRTRDDRNRNLLREYGRCDNNDRIGGSPYERQQHFGRFEGSREREMRGFNNENNHQRYERRRRDERNYFDNNNTGQEYSYYGPNKSGGSSNIENASSSHRHFDDRDKNGSNNNNESRERDRFYPGGNYGGRADNCTSRDNNWNNGNKNYDKMSCYGNNRGNRSYREQEEKFGGNSSIAGGSRGRERGGFRSGAGAGVKHKPNVSLSNLILVDVKPNFRFYLYGVSCLDNNSKMVDSRRRRQELFMKGLLLKGGLLDRMELPGKEIEQVKRGLFFEGSYCFSSRPIPGLEKDRLPRCLIANLTKNLEGEASPPPISENGDVMTVVKVDSYKAPQVLLDSQNDSLPYASVPIDKLDGQCATCNSAYSNLDALMSHCKEKNHTPAYHSDDGIPATKEIFLAFCNVALQRALFERMARWGREYIDPKSFSKPKDRNGNFLGVKVFRAYTCEFGLHRPQVGEKAGKTTMTLTVDLRAKLLRTKSVLDSLTNGYDPNTYRFDQKRQDEALKKWRNEVVICTYDKKCYSVIDLLFDHSAESMPVDGLNMSHAQYFKDKKGISLKYPDAKPLVALLGRNNKTIYLPPELICGNDLDPSLRHQLPTIASFQPKERNDAIDEIKRYLKPGAQKTRGVGGGLLPALGIILAEERMKIPVHVMPIPTIMAAGVAIPKNRSTMWAHFLSKASFSAENGEPVHLNVVVVYHRDLEYSYQRVYSRIAEMVNRFNSTYRFGRTPYVAIRAGDLSDHWGEIERYFKSEQLPSNIFVLDFSKPPRKASSDPAYSTIKQMLSESGYLSQFINFNTHDHGNVSRQDLFRKSDTILKGVSRQILSKCGVRIWWVNIPRSFPLPAVFVGVDVYHAPRKYDPKEKKRTAKESVAAIVVQVVRQHFSHDDSPTVEIYSETARRTAGQEMECGAILKGTVSRALRKFNVNPMSFVIWRDGVGDSTIGRTIGDELPSVRAAFAENNVDPKLSYVLCQKRIATKFLSEDGSLGLPVGTCVDSLQGPDHDTFYINGTCPTYSTPKPVRFIICNRDPDIDPEALRDLTWTLCHDYPNWAGPVKIPSPVKMAHKLAELAGGFVDCGESINTNAFTNKIHFL